MPEGWKSTSIANGSCFIDTGVFFAAYNKNDEMHLDGTLALVSSLLGWFGRAYTSSYVIDETLTLAKAKLGGPEAVRLAESILQSKKITKVNVNEDENIFRDSFERFKEHLDVRGLSFTDCTTLILRERMKIRTLVSFDRSFKPFVPVLLGEGYYNSLSTEQRDLLVKVAQRLDIKLKLPRA
jgi:predicted nucleic acid-binding protein